MIEKALEVKQLLKAGWELWHISYPDNLPGRWEMRYRNQINKVSWDAILAVRRDIEWFSNNLTEVEDGNNWVYMYKQTVLKLGL